MKFIVDESSGYAITKFLKQSGYDVLAVAEVMPQAEDHAILSHAVEEQRVVITNDKDFGELIFRSGEPHFGVLLLRLEDERPENRVRVLKAVLETHLHRLKKKFCVATETQFRIR